MDIVQVPISALKKAAYNPRKITEDEFEQIRQSIDLFGFVQPIIANKFPGREGIIIGGHQRYEVAKKLGMDEVPVLWVSLETKREKELNIRLNRANGSFDYHLLKTEFDACDLTDWGFTIPDLDTNFEGLSGDEIQYPSQKNPKIKNCPHCGRSLK